MCSCICGNKDVIGYLLDEDIYPEFEVLIPEPDMTVSPGQEARLGCQARTDIEVQNIDWTRINADLPVSKCRRPL